MKFGFAYSSTAHTAIERAFFFIRKIEDYLEAEFLDKTFGKGIEKVIFGIGCGGPMLGNWQDRHTGMVIQKAYKKNKKYFEIEIQLSYLEVSSASSEVFFETFLDILKRGLMSTYLHVIDMNIKDFDVDAFYSELERLLDDRDWLNHPEKYVRPLYTWQPPTPKKRMPAKLKMPEDEFWQLIWQVSLHETDMEAQIELLTEELSSKSEQQIVGFELTLRELIKKSYHYHVLALLKIIDDFATDDSLLYFQCNLILLGKDIFYTVVQNPNKLTGKIKFDAIAESLLSVTNQAFTKLEGENADKELPSDFALQYIDYNECDYEMQGKEWDEEDLPKRYKAVMKLYGKLER